MARAPLLQLSEISLTFGGDPVFDGLSLTIQPGDRVALVGRNGSGKSTLMKTLIGLLPAMDGTVSFEGRDMRALKPHQRAHLGIGYVPQGRDVFPRMTVEENLLVGELVGDEL